MCVDEVKKYKDVSVTICSSWSAWPEAKWCVGLNMMCDDLYPASHRHGEDCAHAHIHSTPAFTSQYHSISSQCIHRLANTHYPEQKSLLSGLQLQNTNSNHRVAWICLLKPFPHHFSSWEVVGEWLPLHFVLHLISCPALCPPATRGGRLFSEMPVAWQH